MLNIINDLVPAGYLKVSEVTVAPTTIAVEEARTA